MKIDEKEESRFSSFARSLSVVRTEKKVGGFTASVGVISMILFVTRAFIAGLSGFEIVAHPSFNIVAVGSILLLLLTLSKDDTVLFFSKILHVLIFLSFGTIASFDANNASYSIGFFVLGYMLAYVYGFYHKGAKYRIFASIAYVVAVTEISALFFSNGNKGGYGIEVFIFLFFFMGVLFLCFFQEVTTVKKTVGQLKNEKIKLEKEVLSRTRRIDKLNDQIAILEDKHKPFDLRNTKLSKAEMKVLECLVVYRVGNNEIAVKLGKSEATVKAQIRSIFNKLGVDNRFQVIDLCRHNFPEAQA